MYYQKVHSLQYSTVASKFLVVHKMEVCILKVFLKLDFGARQGSILSLHLFAIYVDDLTDCFLVRNRCLSGMTMTSFSLHAPSVACCRNYCINVSKHSAG